MDKGAYYYLVYKITAPGNCFLVRDYLLYQSLSENAVM